MPGADRVIGDIIAVAKEAAPPRLSQRHIQRHHDAEAHGKENRADVGVLSLRHFGNQLLHHHIEHGARREAQKIRQRRDHQLRRKNRQHRADRLHHAGEHAAEKRLALALALRPERHRDDRALGEVLNGDAKGQDKRACRRDLRVPREEARIHDAYRHALRNVMQGHCQHHHGGAAQPAFRSLRLIASHVKVGNQMVEQKQKQHADPEADKGGKKGQLSHALRLLNSGNQQAPYRRRHHHTGGKAGKRSPHQIAERSFHKEHARRAERRPDKRNQYSERSKDHRSRWNKADFRICSRTDNDPAAS